MTAWTIPPRAYASNPDIGSYALHVVLILSLHPKNQSSSSLNFVIFAEKQTIMETFKEIIEKDQLVLVDFFATWCQPCKMMHPVLVQLKERLGDNIRIVKVDIDKNPDTANAYRIQSVPTLLLFRKGELKWRQSGAIALPDLLSVVNTHL